MGQEPARCPTPNTIHKETFAKIFNTEGSTPHIEQPDWQMGMGKFT
jgi:hypothetical protein